MRWWWLPPVIVVTGLAGFALGGPSDGALSPSVATTRSFVTLLLGDRPVLEYAFQEVPFKPYVRRLLSPAGLNVLRDAPGDHLHHHGLMFAVAIDGVDFWAETPSCGRQIHTGFPLGPQSSGSVASFTEGLEWVGPEGAARLATERRQIVIHASAPDVTLVTWTTVLQPAGRDAIKITGSHYFGLGMRLPASMDGAGEFFTPSGRLDGEVVRGDERLSRGPWCAVAGNVDGRPVTVAVFDAPSCVRPATWFTMARPFAYLGATLNLHREPLAVPSGGRLVLQYGVAVWDGRAGINDINKVREVWLKQLPDVR